MTTITEAAPSLSPAEAKVAAVVMATPGRVVRNSMARLADEAGVSQPTVIRFCRSVGCDGYRAFTVRLAQSLVRRPWFSATAVSAGEPVRAYALKVVDDALDALMRLRQSLDLDAVERAVAALSTAAVSGRIVVYGAADAAGALEEAALRFFTHVAPVHAYTDGDRQRMSASTLGPEDAVIAISSADPSDDLLQAVALARAVGATVVVIAPRSSPIVHLASIPVAADAPEATDAFTPSPARLVHLLLVDVLAVGAALRDDRRSAARADSMKRALRAPRPLGGETLPMPG